MMGWMVAWTQVQIDALKLAMADAKGASLIQHSDGQKIELDLEGQRNLLAAMEREVNTATIQRHRYASVSKGT